MPPGCGLTGLGMPRCSEGARRRTYGSMIWFDHMKTTLDLEDRLLAQAKRRAAARGMTLKAYVEEALRARMLPRPANHEPYHLDLPVIEDVEPPAVDVANRDELYDLMEGRF